MKTFRVTFYNQTTKEIVAEDYMQHGFFIEFTNETPGSWEVVDRLIGGTIRRIEVK